MDEPAAPESVQCFRGHRSAGIEGGTIKVDAPRAAVNDEVEQLPFERTVARVLTVERYLEAGAVRHPGNLYRRPVANLGRHEVRPGCLGNETSDCIPIRREHC